MRTYTCQGGPCLYKSHIIFLSKLVSSRVKKLLQRVYLKISGVKFLYNHYEVSEKRLKFGNFEKCDVIWPVLKILC